MPLSPCFYYPHLLYHDNGYPLSIVTIFLYKLLIPTFTSGQIFISNHELRFLLLELRIVDSKYCKNRFNIPIQLLNLFYYLFKV